MTNAGKIADFSAADNSDSFKFKQKITVKTEGANGSKYIEIVVPLKYLSNFCRALEMPLISSEINLVLTWSEKCVLSHDTNGRTFAITDTERYVPVVTLSTQDNVKLSKTQLHKKGQSGGFLGRLLGPLLNLDFL